MNNKVPHRFKWIISTLQDAGFSFPLIAGGAVRDLYFNRPYRDIDVFVRNDEFVSNAIKIQTQIPAQPQSEADKIIAQLKIKKTASQSFSAGLAKLQVSAAPYVDYNAGEDYSDAVKFMLKADCVVRMGTDITQYYERGNLIHSVYKATFKGSEPVELIVLNVDPMEYFNDYFDVGICKAYFNGKKLHYGPEFVNDVNNRTLSIVGKMDAHQLFGTLKKHIPKLLQYFPKYDVRIVPDKVLKE